ncbi:hypothetical protein [Bacillus massiliglaciei]|uniref:hypothetical protein n=1 Tax=Bacillus massiliglaciei TaxID=1816693 RepID=UPI000DA63E76|nr:hypothetical protein [Bacillus massiliglaciei]
MFFKEDKNHDPIAVHLGYFAAFVFWGAVLFIHTLFDFVEKDFPLSSLFILNSGLALFFVTEFITKKIRKSRTAK